MKNLAHLFPMAAVAAAAVLAGCGGGDTDSAQPTAAGDARATRLAHTVPPLTPAPAGLTGTVFCTDWIIGAVTVDTVEIPLGRTCQLNGTTVTGGVKVEAGGILLAGNGVQIAGSVQGDGAAHMEVTGATSRVGGSVEGAKGGSAIVTGVEVAGSVVFVEMTGAVSVGGVTARSGMKVENSTGGVTIANNTVFGSLQCTGNLPAPAVAGNSADALEDQCMQAVSPPPPTPPSGNVTCVGLTLAGLNLDSIIVPANASCTIAGGTLNGSIEIGANARVTVQDVVVNGGLISDGAADLSVTGASRFNGSVQIQRGARANVAGARIAGNLQIDAMAGPTTASGNTVSGDLQVTRNLAAVTLNGNTVSLLLQCTENVPAPTGIGNVALQKQGQCAGL